MKILQIVESGYRCTIEEQDDPAIWISQVIKNNGADVDFLLRGNAVNYAVVGQDASGLAFGEKKQTQPPKLDQDLSHSLEMGMKVFAITEDFQIRGIDQAKVVTGIKTLSRQELPGLFEEYDQIWHW